MSSVRRHLVAAVAAATFRTSLPAVAAEPLTAEQKAAVQAIVRDYIVEHPEVVLVALQAMDARQKAAEQAAAPAALIQHRDALERRPGDPVLGNPHGDVTIVETFDYRCGYFTSMLEPLLDPVHSD